MKKRILALLLGVCLAVMQGCGESKADTDKVAEKVNREKK